MVAMPVSRLRVRLGTVSVFFLEDESGKQGHDFGGFVICEDVVEDELCEDQLVGGMDLAGYFAL